MNKIEIDLLKELDKYSEQTIESKLDSTGREYIENYTNIAGVLFNYHVLKQNGLMGEKKLKKYFSYVYECLDYDYYKEYADNGVILFDSIIKKSSLPKPLTLYRGTSASFFNDSTIIKNNRMKSLVYNSTTIDESAAKGFAEGDKLIIQFELPKNYPALWLRPFSYYKSEFEFLIGRNQGFEIIKKENFDKNKIKKIIVKPLH